MKIVAVPQQDAIEVYVHPDGDAVAIRQQSGMDDPDIVLIAPQNVERVIRALRAAKREAKEQGS